MTELLNSIKAEVDSVRPGVKLSASVHANRTLAEIHWMQKWSDWLRDGLLDFVVPMNYRSGTEFSGNTEDAASHAWNRHIYMGQGTWMLTGENAAEQLAEVRNRDYPGFVLYSYAYLLGERSGNRQLMSALTSSVISESAAVPTMPWKSR